jgi:hypothetical protein
MSQGKIQSVCVRVSVACAALLLAACTVCGCAAASSSSQSSNISAQHSAGATSADSSASSGSFSAGTSSSGAASAGSTSASNQQSAHSQNTDVDPEELSQSLPKQGLPETYIDQSWLGTHDREQEIDGATIYYWQARNGTDDTVYSAKCEGGTVVRVTKFYPASGYWPTLRGLPDLYTTTPFDDSDEDASNKYSPRDYDSAEEYEADTGGSLDEWDRQ